MTDSQPLIKVEGLYKIFGKQAKAQIDLAKQGMSKAELMEKNGHALGLNNINLDIDAGEIFVIMGLSGSGKSTLIRHFNRLIEPTAGAIWINGQNIVDLDKKALREFRRKTMAMVFQHFGLLPHYRVLENVAFGLKTQGVGKVEREAKAMQWLKDVGLEGLEKQYPSQLSGGQQQRVGLARALCTDADILLMDEAFSALDPLIRNEMQQQLLTLQEKLAKTIVFITHDLDEALRIGDRIAILQDGNLEQVGSAMDILLHPANDYVRTFVQDVNRARALKIKAVMVPACNDTYDSIIRVSQDELIEEAIPIMLQNKGRIAVINSDGEVKGKLDANTLAAILL
jgi:glycine betaine/proline transport system ATP-binding protein